MRWDIGQRKQFTRRALVLAGGKLLLVSGLVANLYKLQVVEASRYRILADDNRINIRLLPPERGPIVDRFGEGMAVNRQTYQLVLVSEQTDSVADTLERIGALVELSEHDIRWAIEETGRRDGFCARHRAGGPLLARGGEHRGESPRAARRADRGEPEPLLPYGALAAHVTGYVGAVSEAELTGDRLLELPGFLHRQERRREGLREGPARIRPVCGTSRSTPTGRIIREISRVEGASGSELRLTIDMGLPGVRRPAASRPKPAPSWRWTCSTATC